MCQNDTVYMQMPVFVWYVCSICEICMLYLSGGHSVNNLMEPEWPLCTIFLLKAKYSPKTSLTIIYIRLKTEINPKTTTEVQLFEVNK